MEYQNERKRCLRWSHVTLPWPHALFASTHWFMMPSLTQTHTSLWKKSRTHVVLNILIFKNLQNSIKLKKKKNQIISLKNRKVRAFASVCAKIHVYFRIKPIFSILHTHFSKYYASNYIFYTTFIKISIFLDFFNCFSFVTHNNRHLFSSIILVNN